MKYNIDTCTAAEMGIINKKTKFFTVSGYGEETKINNEMGRTVFKRYSSPLHRNKTLLGETIFTSEDDAMQSKLYFLHKVIAPQFVGIIGDFPTFSLMRKIVRENGVDFSKLGLYKICMGSIHMMIINDDDLSSYDNYHLVYHFSWGL